MPEGPSSLTKFRNSEGLMCCNKGRPVLNARRLSPLNWQRQARYTRTGADEAVLQLVVEELGVEELGVEELVLGELVVKELGVEELGVEELVLGELVV